MNLELIKLTPSSRDRSIFQQINNEAFPPSERMSLDEIFAFASATSTDVLGIYDHEAPVGFAVLLKNTDCGYLYFIAIDSRTRSRGYGGTAL